jgi:creatinine amidohydrolase
MTSVRLAICIALTMGPALAAQRLPDPSGVEMEFMTSPEVFRAIHDQGKTTAIVFNGGTEQRGPHGVLGGHTFMARALAVEIARRLGNALVAPVLPIGSTGLVGPKIPGGIGLPTDLLEQVYEAIVEDLVDGGFRTVVVMGDHGTGQEQLERAAETMNTRYAAQGVRVIYSVDQYEKAREVFNEYAMRTMTEGFDYGTHAGLYDTSMLLYLQPAPGVYVRDNYRTVTPNPAPPPGQEPPPGPPPADNGVSGDPRFATPELGQKMMEIKVDLAVAEIARKLAGNPAAR